MVGGLVKGYQPLWRTCAFKEMEKDDNRQESNNQFSSVGWTQTSRVRQFNDLITSLHGVIKGWIDDTSPLFITSFLGDTSRKLVKDGRQRGQVIGLQDQLGRHALTNFDDARKNLWVSIKRVESCNGHDLRNRAESKDFDALQFRHVGQTVWCEFEGTRYQFIETLQGKFVSLGIFLLAKVAKITGFAVLHPHTLRPAFLDGIPLGVSKICIAT